MATGFVEDTGSPDAPPVLRARDLHKSYGRHQILAGVDITLRAGEIVALVGENGAGKSTLVHCLAGMQPTDSGTVDLRAESLAVVWQDLSLCENLDVVANLFLGRELRRVMLSEDTMQREAGSLLADLAISVGDLRRPVSLLSGGQRQSVAIARALLGRPEVLILDEPTAALGVQETRALHGLLRRLRARGVAILLVSHRIDEVFDLADRISILRHGRMVADVATVEVHPDDVISLMSGIESDSAARRQLRLLRSLVDQLSEVEPSASLSLIVSSLSSALGLERLTLHLVERPNTESAPRSSSVLVPRAATGLSADTIVNRARNFDDATDFVAVVAASAERRVSEDVRVDPLWASGRDELAADQVVSAWAVPIIGSDGVLGVITAYDNAPGRPRDDQLELMGVYTNLAAAAIERERLLAEVTRRNRVLESLRGMLETLAGPDQLDAGMSKALDALGRGLGASVVALYAEVDGVAALRAIAQCGNGEVAPGDDRVLERAATLLLASTASIDRARLLADDLVGLQLSSSDIKVALLARWSDAADLTDDAIDLLEDAGRSLRLAVEREEVETAHKEANALRRSHSLQLEFLSRLSHELRTPLTAIHGYASTLRQTDVHWDDDTQGRFLEVITNESARMGRLVADLLDSSNLDAGGLRLLPDWCEMPLVISEAVACVRGASTNVTVDVPVDMPRVWADHDRIEQVIVNIVDNAFRHGPRDRPVSVTIRARVDAGLLALDIIDNGRGLTAEFADVIFQPYVRADGAGPGAGLGLTIARGIVEAHGGRVWADVSEPGEGARVHVVLPVEPRDGPHA